jgi:hypothetical protein
MMQLATGKTASGISWRLEVSEPVDVEDMRNIANLLHAGALKVENEDRGAQPQPGDSSG